MKKQITFEQLKKIVKEAYDGQQNRWGDRKPWGRRPQQRPEPKVVEPDRFLWGKQLKGDIQAIYFFFQLASIAAKRLIPPSNAPQVSATDVANEVFVAGSKHLGWKRPDEWTPELKQAYYGLFPQGAKAFPEACAKVIDQEIATSLRKRLIEYYKADKDNRDVDQAKHDICRALDDLWWNIKRAAKKGSY